MSIHEKNAAALLPLLRDAGRALYRLLPGVTPEAIMAQLITVSEATRGEPDEAAVAALLGRLRPHLEPLALFTPLCVLQSKRAPFLADQIVQIELLERCPDDGLVLLLVLLAEFSYGTLDRDFAGWRLPLFQAIVNAFTEADRDELLTLGEYNDGDDGPRYYLTCQTRVFYGNENEWTISISEREAETIAEMLGGGDLFLILNDLDEQPAPVVGAVDALRAFCADRMLPISGY